MYFTEYLSKVGNLILISDGENLVGLFFSFSKAMLPSKYLKDLKEDNNLEVFKDTKLWLDKYFKGEEVSSNDLKILLIGTEFRKKVWQELLNIPYGKTITYKNLGQIIAQKLGRNKMSAQAIGNAVGNNPIPIIIPCHRVIGSNGDLTGYLGGLPLKAWLLELEKKKNIM